jgi:predicted nucleic acid-binding protein
MTLPLFVSDSSPIIAFEHLDLLDLLRQLTNALYVPPAVRREVFAERAVPSWIKERGVSYPISLRTLRPRLGLGESEAITLALEMLPCHLILDDLAARRAAQSMKIPVVGTVGLLLLARQRNLLVTLKPSLDTLIESDFRISKDLYRWALQSSGEWEQTQI